MVKLWTSAICLAALASASSSAAQAVPAANPVAIKNTSGASAVAAPVVAAAAAPVVAATPALVAAVPSPGTVAPAAVNADANANTAANTNANAAANANANAAANANANAAANANANAAVNTNTTQAAAPGTLKGTNPLVIKGHRFFDSVTGEYFGMRGVNYYPRPNAGPLDANNLDFFTAKYSHVWQRDIPQFVALSANSIRLYAVDPLADHTDFMCRLQAEGIYVVVDLGSSCQGCEITADKAPACYPASYKTRGEQIIQNFAKYDNVIAFSGGNEINHRTGGNGPEWNAPCQKKFIRDMRQYIASCPQMRKIPMGLVVADTNRDDNALYYNCLTDPSDKMENAEWYGINVYVQCDAEEDPTKAAGFNNLRKSFADYKYSIPTVLTEFGCTSKGFPTIDGYEAQRTFHDAKWMNQAEYSDIFNGGFAFEYTTENANSKSTSAYPFKAFGPQNYGLGFLTPETCTDEDKANGCKFTRFPNFHSLAAAYKSTDTSKEPTLQSFKVPGDRTQRSKCPAKFPKLKDLTWAGDAQKSISCPQIKRYQCPNVAPSQDAIPAALEAAEVDLLQAVSTDGSATSSVLTPSAASPSDSITEEGEGDEQETSASGSVSKQEGQKTEKTVGSSATKASVSDSVVATAVAAACTALLMAM